jgi:creatinine amidohydrolase
MKPVLWADLTWENIRDMRADGVDMVLFPIGSTEQHGPHLPLSVDTLSAEIVAHAVSARTAVPVLPTLPFGCALGHTRHWPGTLSLSPATLTQVVVEILDDVIAYGFTRILMLSGHVTNAAPLRCALEVLRSKHPELQIAQKHVCEASLPVKAAYESDALDWHANAAETALMLHLAPQLVRTERIFDDPDRTRELVFSYSVPQTSLEGHTGSPSLATAEMGAELFETVVRDWTYVVKKALIEKPPLSSEAEAPPPPEIQPEPPLLETLPDALFGRPS